MTLQNLVGISLDSIEIDRLMIRRLIEAAQSSLQDAKLKTISNESRFDLAYKAIMQMSKAALQAKGYRVLTSKPGHHQLMLQALPLTIGLDKTRLILLDQLRKQRNAIDYSGDLVSDALTSEAITQAESLLTLVKDRFRS
ncbi:DNA-binding protein [Polynucleobacter sp. Tro8-14-1]|nr:DNA-binding protein [Polynucleobacter sp. Tro8-14-1]MBU3602898.1 DNA-binding protein [Polynucleobacter sp. AP-Kaivos-20-H2]